ncbi:Serine-arginine protein 55, partial [Armadillidium vulgare]
CSVKVYGCSIILFQKVGNNTMDRGRRHVRGSKSMVGTRVYVGGLNHRVSERDVERFFRGYGRLRDIIIKNGFGFVEFEDHRDADDAVYELNGKDLMGERFLLNLQEEQNLVVEEEEEVAAWWVVGGGGGEN